MSGCEQEPARGITQDADHETANQHDLLVEELVMIAPYSVLPR
jgi:hypothetical protein